MQVPSNVNCLHLEYQYVSYDSRLQFLSLICGLCWCDLFEVRAESGLEVRVGVSIFALPPGHARGGVPTGQKGPQGSGPRLQVVGRREEGR